METDKSNTKNIVLKGVKIKSDLKFKK